MNLYVSNLSFNTTDDKLRQLFEKFGAVSSAKVILDRSRAQSDLTEMSSQKEASEAIQDLTAKRWTVVPCQCPKQGKASPFDNKDGNY
jgi:hypothetical protein